MAAAADEEFCRQLILEESQAKEREQADAKLAKQLLDEEYASRQDQAVSNSQPSSVSPYQTKPPPPPPPKRVRFDQRAPLTTLSSTLLAWSILMPCGTALQTFMYVMLGPDLCSADSGQLM